MFNLQIICVGKYKESYWSEAETEYLKRLKPYAKIEILEISEEQFNDSSDKEKIKKIEAEKILKQTRNSNIIVALHERGKEFTSQKLAEWLEENSRRGEQIVFILGGPLGLHNSLLEKSTNKLSLSKLTFPHQMARVILLEQIYRAGTIVNNKTYHY
ncbi:MAG: 23S rRNA (pseudouridine(1915)-N(3))-methyltransferase RlmH [Patescibacteria group bacterium]